MPAHAAFHAEQETLVLRSDNGFVALARGEAPSIGRYLAPLESMWGLACPVVGADPVALAREVVRELVLGRQAWDALWLGGMPVNSPLLRAMASLLATVCAIRWGPHSGRFAAAIDRGFEAWLRGRSAKFRANLRRELRGAARDHIAIEPALATSEAEAAALYERILAIEARSWKGRDGVGITEGAMRVFYARALALLAPRGRVRCLIARHEGRDVGFIFGGVLGDTYRGLQVSFDADFRSYGLGNVLQAHMIRHLAAEGIAVYDLGSEIAYKSRWAEAGLETATLVALRR